MSDFADRCSIRVAIVGAGFAGSILARQLIQDGRFQVTVFEQAAKTEFRTHWTQPLTGAALNVNANGMATIKEFDPELYEILIGISSPRKQMRSVSVDKNVGAYFDIPDIVSAGLSDCYGAICRWDDANRAIRDLLPVGTVQWATKIDSFDLNHADHTITVKVSSTGNNDSANSKEFGPFDLLVAADGRYSSIRRHLLQSKPAETEFEEVCNFRLLVPDTTNGLFSDLELLYNIPDPKNAPTAEMASNIAFQGLARAGVACCPPSKFFDQGSIYIFGNFAVPRSPSIPEEVKTAEFLTALFTPAGGVECLTDKGRWLLETLQREASKLHWARFQHIAPAFATDDLLTIESKKQPILLLGDAAHAFCPALGQGATMAIEDAFAAAAIIRQHLDAFATEADTDKKEVDNDSCATYVDDTSSSASSSVANSGAYVTDNNKDKQWIISAISAIRSSRHDRIEMAKDLSIAAGEHMMAGDRLTRLQKEVDNWSETDGTWLKSMREVWTGYPRKGVNTPIDI